MTRVKTVYLYLAYHLDYYAFGSRSDAMAAGCKGSSFDDKSCNLWEFLSYIQKAGYAPDAGTLPSMSNDIASLYWPIATDAAPYINKITVHGSMYMANYDVDKIFPAGTVDGRTSAILDTAAARINAAAKKLGPRDSSEGVFNAQNAITGVQQARIHTWVPELADLFTAFNKKFELNVTLYKTSKQAIDGSYINYLDLERTSAEATDLESVKLSFYVYWQSFIINYIGINGAKLRKRDGGSTDIYAATKLQNIASVVFSSGRRQSC